MYDIYKLGIHSTIYIKIARSKKLDLLLTKIKYVPNSNVKTTLSTIQGRICDIVSAIRTIHPEYNQLSDQQLLKKIFEQPTNHIYKIKIIHLEDPQPL